MSGDDPKLRAKPIASAGEWFATREFVHDLEWRLELHEAKDPHMRTQPAHGLIARAYRSTIARERERVADWERRHVWAQRFDAQYEAARRLLNEWRLAGYDESL